MMKKIKKILPVVLAVTLVSQMAFPQEFSKSSLKTAVGIGINEGKDEIGVGALILIGYQKTLWKDRLRLTPNITSGNFIPFGITDTRDQYYRITSLGFNGYLDALKYKAVSLFIGTGVFMNFSRGLLGTGGWPEEGNTTSEYFLNYYYGGYLGAGIRIEPKGRRISYELTPINFQFGNDYFFTTYFKFGIDIKFSSK